MIQMAFTKPSIHLHAKINVLDLVLIPIIFNPVYVFLQDALMSQDTYNLSDDLKKTLHDITALNNYKNSKVALSARQVIN